MKEAVAFTWLKIELDRVTAPDRANFFNKARGRVDDARGADRDEEVAFGERSQFQLGYLAKSLRKQLPDDNRKMSY